MPDENIFSGLKVVDLASFIAVPTAARILSDFAAVAIKIIQAALCGANFYGLHDRAHPANAALNVYKSSDGTWFVLVVTPDKVPVILKALSREDILKDPRFSDPAKLAQNRPQLTSMLDEIFGSQPMSHWYEVFSGAQITFGAVREPQEVVNDPQLRANDIVVPLEGAGEKLSSTISSPIQVHGVTKVPE